jgi:hypothetical protein
MQQYQQQYLRQNVCCAGLLSPVHASSSINLISPTSAIQQQIKQAADVVPS